MLAGIRDHTLSGASALAVALFAILLSGGCFIDFGPGSDPAGDGGLLDGRVDACLDGRIDGDHGHADGSPTDGSENGDGGQALDAQSTDGGPLCGNGVAEDQELCDGADLSGETCMSRGYFEGTLACTGSCQFDESDCTNCGDGQCHPSEGESADNCHTDCGWPPQILASGLNQPVGIAVDTTHVYWSNSGSGEVMRTLKNGTGAEEYLVTGLDEPRALVLQGSDLYFVEPGAGDTVSRVPKAGGTLEHLVSGEGEPVGLDCNGTWLVWTNYTDDSIGIVELGSGDSPAYATDHNGPFGISLTDANVAVFVTTVGGEVVAHDLLLGTDTVIIASQDSPYGVVTDNGYVYWTNHTTAGQVKRIPVGSGLPVILADDQDHPYALAVDDTYVYWTNRVGGTVKKTQKDGGGSPILLARDLERPFFIAVDDTHVYWTDFEAGTVSRVPK
jgi:hypothetical protein